MMAIRHDIVVEQGATFLREFLVQDEPEDDYRAPVDLSPASACTAQGHIHDAEDHVVVVFTATVADRVVPTADPAVSVNGWTVTAGISSTNTATVTPERLHYVLTVTHSISGVVYRVAEGRVRVDPD
jgi:hypothetical protein